MKKKKDNWTKFWDMHSGGGVKEAPYELIFIEAPLDEAKIIFYNRFGHNPERVTCTCCGGDYVIDGAVSLEQATGYHRNCCHLETPRNKNGLYMNDHPIIKQHYYLEKGEKPPKGFEVDKDKPYGKYQTLEKFEARDDVLVIRGKDIKPKERKGEVPEQGYIWVN